jgi:hypothetical protein
MSRRRRRRHKEVMSMVRKSGRGGGGGMQLPVVHQKPSRRGNEWQGPCRLVDVRQGLLIRGFLQDTRERLIVL